MVETGSAANGEGSRRWRREVGAWVRRAADPLPGRERDFALYWLASLAIFGGWGWTMPVQAVYLFEAGLSLGSIGVIQAVAGMASFACQAYLGRWSDRVARRKPFLLGALAASAPLLVVFPVARDPVVLGALITMLTVLQAAYVTMLYTSVSSLSGARGAGTTFSAYRISGSIGWVLTSLSLGWLLGWVGIRGVYLLAAGTYLAVSLALALVLPEPPMEPHAAGGPARSARAGTRAAKPAGGAAVLAGPGLGAFYGAMVLTTFGLAAGTLYFPIFLREEMRAGESAFATLMAMPAMFEVPFMLWVGRASDRWGPAAILVAGAAAGALRWSALPYAPTPLHVAPLQVLGALSFSSAEILGVTFLSRRVGLSLRGSAMGFLSSLQALGRLAAPLLVGAAGQRWGFASIFWLTGAASVGAAALFAVAHGRTRRLPAPPMPGPSGTQRSLPDPSAGTHTAMPARTGLQRPNP